MQTVTSKEMTWLVGLLRFGLFGDAVPADLPSDEGEWRSLFELSRRQAVTALLYDAIVLLPKEKRPPRSVLFHFATLTQTIEDDNRRREEALLSFASLCDGRLFIMPIVVKGSSLASRYPVPLHRECGDNDLLSGIETERIAAMMEQMGVPVDRKDPRHITFEYKGTTFECHRYLLYHNDDPHWHRDKDFGDTCLDTLQIEEEAFFLAKHCEHHAVFFHNPVRLRTLVDWSLLLGSKDFDFAAFDRIKRYSDVRVFADLMTLYCNELFGLHLRDGLEYLKDEGLKAADFDRLYMQCPQRHPNAVVRVARRSWKYLRFDRYYRAIYGKSMFSRFYLSNLKVAIRNLFRRRI